MPANKKSAASPKKSKSSGKSKSKTPVASDSDQSLETAVPVPTSTPPPTASSDQLASATESVTTVSKESVEFDVEGQFRALNEKIVQLRTLEASIVSDLRKLQKSTSKYLKSLNKKGRKAPTQQKKRAPSGFAKPTVISKQLCDFLGESEGVEMARTEVTKKLTEYIKAQDLQDPSNRRIIKPDKKLRKLLGVKNDQEVTYFNLQKFMKVHFPKQASSSSSEASAVVV